jgi:hypothetical protein
MCIYNGTKTMESILTVTNDLLTRIKQTVPLKKGDKGGCPNENILQAVFKRHFQKTT